MHDAQVMGSNKTGGTATTGCFAPPVLIIPGKAPISQSVAATLCLGKHLGLIPDGYDEFKVSRAVWRGGSGGVRD